MLEWPPLSGVRISLPISILVISEKLSAKRIAFGMCGLEAVGLDRVVGVNSCAGSRARSCFWGSKLCSGRLMMHHASFGEVQYHDYQNGNSDGMYGVYPKSVASVRCAGRNLCRAHCDNRRALTR